MALDGSNAGEVLFNRLGLLRLLLSLLLAHFLADLFRQLLLLFVALLLGNSLEQSLSLSQLADLSVNFLGRGGSKQLDRFKHDLHVERNHKLFFSLRLLLLFMLLLVLLLGLLVLFRLLGLQDLHSLLLPLSIGSQLGSDLGRVHPYFLLLLNVLGSVTLEVVQVVYEEVDKFDLSQVLLELGLFLSFFIPLLVLCTPGLSLFVCNLSVFDSGLPLDEINVVLLLPVFVCFLMVFVPDLVVLLSNLDDLFLVLIKALFFVFFPGFILVIVTLLLLVRLTLFGSHSLHRVRATCLSPVICWFFLSSSSLRARYSLSMGSFSALILLICSSSSSLRSSACSSLISMFPELSASLIFLFSNMISLLMSFYSFLDSCLVIWMCSSSFSLSLKFYRLPFRAALYYLSFSFWSKAECTLALALSMALWRSSPSRLRSTLSSASLSLSC